ncbi:9172_t:CDS:2 [Cetraspora pellucida]|uniref:9172_t:CDS:1 n=1 Tax=Cetraspora pellucida TaxID=1433469 RepID=A0A9N9PA86_9GLOM|nr:9172_t:CDS:2 [Cetraspora pellucida]
MAPRQDRTPLVLNRTTRGASSPGFYFGTLSAISTFGGGNFEGGVRTYDSYMIRNNVGELYPCHAEYKKKNIINGNKRKVYFNLAHAVREHTESLRERDKVIALEQEAMMYKFKRQEIQAQARELRRKIHKKNKEIRQKRHEVKYLRIIERELIEYLEKCESQSREEAQPVIQVASPLAFGANLYRVYVLCAALISFLLVRVVSYGSIVVNRV